MEQIFNCIHLALYWFLLDILPCYQLRKCSQCYFKAVFSNQIGIVQPYTWTMFALVLAIIATLTTSKRTNQTTTYCDCPIQDLTTIKGQTIFFTFIGITIILAYVGNTAFIYGNF